MPRRFRDYGWGGGYIDEFDVDDVVKFVNSELRPTGIYLSDADIKKYVCELEDLGGLEGFGFRGDELTRKLTDHLDKDKDSNNRGQGMYRSRHRFLVLSYAARRTRSKDVANALMRFWTRGGSDIIRREEHILLTEWCTAIMQLQNLADEDKWQRAFNQVASLGPPMFEEWQRSGPHRSMAEDILSLFRDLMLDHGRGRHHLQPYDVPVRRLSVSARRPSFIELPPYPRTGYNSPLLSPMHDAFNLLHEQQHRQQYDIARLEHRIGNLRDRY